MLADARTFRGPALRSPSGPPRLARRAATPPWITWPGSPREKRIRLWGARPPRPPAPFTVGLDPGGGGDGGGPRGGRLFPSWPPKEFLLLSGSSQPVLVRAVFDLQPFVY